MEAFSFLDDISTFSFPVARNQGEKRCVVLSFLSLLLRTALLSAQRVKILSKREFEKFNRTAKSKNSLAAKLPLQHSSGYLVATRVGLGKAM